MEMQQVEKEDNMAKISSYDLASGAQGTKWYTSRRTFVWLTIVFLAICISVALFIGGYYLGISAGHIPSQPRPHLISDDIEWDGVCPKKTESCPESYQGIPPVLLLSIDGFRPDYLNRQLTPTLHHLYQCGTRSPYMYPVFPSKTFPNHYSIVTGLYPESHGIIDNNMYDPKKRKTFKVGVKGFLDSFWWEAEPIWITAKQQGKRSSLYFWPGSEVKFNNTMYADDFKKYKSTIPFAQRVDQIIQWLERPKETRPDFLTLYVNQPDKAGHTYGISSNQVNDALVAVDEMIAKLFVKLQQRNLLNCINIIITSDHGMADTGCSRMILLQDYLNASDFYSVVGSLGRLRAKNASITDVTISNLQCKNEHMRVYSKAQIPIRFHYSSHPRIEPIYLDLDSGWSFLNWKPQNNSCLRGGHGYDNYYEDMQALFMAYGPSFKLNHTVEPFLNLELYELMCDLMNITANPNNGTKGSLHHLLRQHEPLPKPEQPPVPLTGTVATEELEYHYRRNGVNCTCKQNISDQTDLENTTLAESRHVPFGLPYNHLDTVLYQSFLVLHNEDYILGYDKKYRLPLWASFTLSTVVAIKDFTPCWRGDTRVPVPESPRCSYYQDPRVIDAGIVQSSLFPTTFANSSNLEDSFMVTNSVPKHENHLILIERHLLEMVSTWVRNKKSVNVIAGPAFDFNNDGVLPQISKLMSIQDLYGSLIVPTHYFYIVTWCEKMDTSVADCEPGKLDVVSFLLPNLPLAYNCETSNDLLKKHLARVVDIENLTGISFYTGLPIYDTIRLRTKISHV